MSKTQYTRNLYARCPFYVRTGKDNISIKCEGVIGVYTITVFKTKAEMQEYSHTYCCDRCEDCKMYKALDQKWEEKFEEERKKKEPRF